MQTNENMRIEIHGHICCKDDDIGNLSVLRAMAIYNYLSVKGIDEKRMRYKGFGSKRPIHPLPEKTETQRIANRRVEIVILEN